MPIYEYICPRCHIRFEQLLPLSRSGEDTDCPACKSRCGRAISKFVSRASSDMSMLDHVPSGGGGSSCGGCTSSNCSTCG
ncbi:MAG: zinc ribbon domain-containing protein [Chloroflexi bacterium]|nr:zinc ribbon domain-containing protein [Chloroflexota bacterium]